MIFIDHRGCPRPLDRCRRVRQRRDQLADDAPNYQQAVYRWRRAARQGQQEMSFLWVMPTAVAFLTYPTRKRAPALGTRDRTSPSRHRPLGLGATRISQRSYQILAAVLRASRAFFWRTRASPTITGRRADIAGRMAGVPAGNLRPPARTYVHCRPHGWSRGLCALASPWCAAVAIALTDFLDEFTSGSQNDYFAQIQRHCDE